MKNVLVNFDIIGKWSKHVNESDVYTAKALEHSCNELATCVRKNLKSYFKEKYGSNFFEDILMKRIVLNGEDLERFKDYMKSGSYIMRGERR